MKYRGYIYGLYPKKTDTPLQQIVDDLVNSYKKTQKEWMAKMIRESNDDIKKYIKSKQMKTITLENGQKVEISEESYNALAKAVQKEVTWSQIWKIHCNSTELGQQPIDSKIWAIKQVLITAKYLNGDWMPNWENDSEDKYYLSVMQNEIYVLNNQIANGKPCYFKSEKRARRCVNILGEETIKTALGDY